MKRIGGRGPGGEGYGKINLSVRRDENILLWGAALRRGGWAGLTAGELYLTQTRFVWLIRGETWLHRLSIRKTLRKQDIGQMSIDDGGMACSGFRWGIEIETPRGPMLFRFYGKLAESKMAAEEWQEAIGQWARN